MKKYLFPALALGLVMTSCQSDEPFAPGEGGEKQVTFTLNVPGELGTRAGAAGNESDKGGFSNDQGTLSYTLVLTANGDSQVLKAAGEDKEVVFTPTVVLGREYTVTAYAHFGDALDSLTAIEIKKGFNDESKDAYTWTGKINFATDQDGTNQNITLTRPFGKLRLVATDYVAGGESLNTEIKSVKVTYTDRQAATFNATTGLFAFANDYVNATEADVFDGYYQQQTEGTTTLTIMFADYIPANPGDNMVDFTVEVTYTNDEKYSRTFNDIPVKRNALTTLKGNFFTAEAEIKVEVKDAFEGQIPGNDEEQLIIAAAMGGAYTLQGNIELSKPLNITTNMTLNLNGNTLTASNSKGDVALIEVAEGVSAKLMGGTIENTTPNGDAAINNAGELVLENITIEGAPLADGGYSAYAVISSGKLTIGEGVNVSADRGCLKFSGAGETVSEVETAGLPDQTGGPR